MFFIAILAETNRPPFDLPEARFGHKKLQNSYIYGFVTFY
jgi:NADH:ubiquinone oxidoreductase subunit H